MKNLNLYALANELNLGDPRSGTIRIPFGRWDFGEKQLGDGRTVYFEQELSKFGAEQIAAKVNAGVAAGEKGVPVYWGHPDVPELAHKYPDKRAKGWIKSASIGPDFLELHVEWLEDNATDGFGWFSPYWGGPAEHLANGRYLKTVNDLTSVALVNIPNIQEFRLANESQGGEQTKGKAFAMPQHLIDLARRFDERVRLANEANFDESKHPRSDDGKFSSGGGGGSATVKKVDPSSTPGYRQEQEKNRQLDAQVAKVQSGLRKFEATERKAREFMMGGKIPWGDRSKATSVVNDKLAEWRAGMRYKPEPGTVPYHHEVLQRTRENIRGLHMAAIKAGLTYNPKTHKYE